MAITRIGNPALADVREPNFRNIIINGDQSIAQRSTSVSSITAAGYNTIDRIKTNISSAGTWTQSQSTTVPTGQGFATSLKMDCTTADGSLSAADYLALQHIIEGQNLQYLKKGTSSAESTTLSFWVRSNKTGTYICTLYDNDNNRNISKSYTISSADTWEKKTITYVGDTTGTFGNDNAASLYLNFYLAAGSNYTSGTLATSWESYTQANEAVGQVNLADSTSNEWYVTGIQLEAGSVASDFEFLPVDVNLRRCQRYCYAVNGIASDETGLVASGLATSTSTLKISIDFPVPMRAYPSVSEAGLQANIVGGAQDVSLNTLQDNVNSTFNPSNITINLGADSGTPFTAGHSLVLRLDNATSANLKLDAEL